MKRPVLFSVGFRGPSGAETETRGLDFVQAVEEFSRLRDSGFLDIWIYYDPFPGCL